VTPPAKGVDAGPIIQAAIDQVSKLPLDANGFRGAVLLAAGLYPIGGQIRITTSGVILRGEGTDVTGTGLTGTVLEATGTSRRYDPHRQVSATHFAFSAVDVQKMSKWVTVTDSQSLDPVSQIAGGRRDSFELGGQLTLVENCYSFHGRHDFVLHSALPGPNVFLNCVADQSYDEAGPHLHWDTGVLYDNVVDHSAHDKLHPFGGSLEARNRGLVDGSLQGWTGANVVFWNCTADTMDVEQPPTAQNWAIGCMAKFTPTSNGLLESIDQPVDPQSLYRAQLEDRLAREYGVAGLVRVTARPLPGPANAESVTVTNASDVTIPGPVLIVFTSLPQGVALAAISGQTTAGDPFVTASLIGLEPGRSATTTFRFTAPLPSHGLDFEFLAGLPQV
jgi:hypothetical protein